MELSVVIMAFCAGLALRRLGYPPLLGYLAAGFVAHMLGLGDGDNLKPLADAGIVLLLFMIGLHLKLSDLRPRYVWGSAILHMLIALPLTTAVIYARCRVVIFRCLATANCYCLAEYSSHSVLPNCLRVFR